VNKVKNKTFKKSFFTFNGFLMVSLTKKSDIGKLVQFASFLPFDGGSVAEQDCSS
jgi:hypothetical protein